MLDWAQFPRASTPFPALRTRRLSPKDIEEKASKNMSGRRREFDETTVVDAAMDVFWSNGYEGSSAQALCEGTGLGRGSLYNAFGSKQELYERALRRYQDLGFQAQAQILHGTGPVKERLRALLKWGIEGDLDGAGRRGCMALFAIMERGRKDPVVEQINRAYVAQLEAALCHVFAIGQRSGEISSERPALEMGRAFLSGYYGLRILGLSMPDRAFLEDVMEGTLARL